MWLLFLLYPPNAGASKTRRKKQLVQVKWKEREREMQWNNKRPRTLKFVKLIHWQRQEKTTDEELLAVARLISSRLPILRCTANARFLLKHRGGLKFKSAKQQTNDRRYSRHNKTPNTLRKDVKIAFTILSDKFHLQNESMNESECKWNGVTWSRAIGSYGVSVRVRNDLNLRFLFGFFLSFRLPSVRRLTSLASFVSSNCTRRKFSSFLITSFRCGRNSPSPLLYRVESEIGNGMK